jgi:outer membrane lipoprotein-sorting protein
MTAPVSRSTAALIAVLAVTVLAGCGVFLDAESSLPEGEQAAEQYESLDSYNATYRIEVTDENGTRTWTGNRTISPSTGQFYERYEGPEGNRTVTVNNGSVTWVYDIDSDDVTKYRASRGQLGGHQIRQLVNGARQDGSSDPDPIVPVSPIVPFVGQSSDEVVSVGPKEISYEGTESIAGREAHVIEVTTAEETSSFEQRHYLDTEWFVRLKITSQIERDGNLTELHYRYTDIEYEPELPEDVFEFTPPADAVVEETPVRVSTYESRREAADQTATSLPGPDVPERFRLSQLLRTITDGGRFDVEYSTIEDPVETVTLRYTSERSRLIVTKTNSTLDADTDGEQIELGNQTARYQQTAGQRFVRWTCDGNQYSVSGGLPREELIDVAESVVCD